MADKIRLEDIIDPRIKKEFKEIADNTQKVIAQFEALLAASKKVNEETKKGVTTSEQLNKVKKTTTDTSKKLSDVEKEVAKIEEKHYQVITKMVAERSKENKKLEEAKQKRAEQNKTVKESIALTRTEVNSIARLQLENKKLITERNKVNTATKEGEKRIKEINAQLDKNTKLIKDNSSAAEKQKGNIGNYVSAFKNLGTTLLAATGITMGLAGAKKILQSVIASTKRSNDVYQIAVESLSGAFDVLKKSIATLDFDYLITRMGDAARAGRNYAMAMAELGDRWRSYNLQEAETRAKTDLMKEKLTDETLTIKERIAVGEELLASEKNLRDIRKGILSDISDKELDKLGARIGLDREQLTGMIRTYNASKKTREEAVEYNKVLKKLTQYRKEGQRAEDDRLARLQGARDTYRGLSVDQKASNRLTEEEGEILKKTSSNARLYAGALREYGKAADEELNKVTSALIGVAQADSDYASEKRRTETKVQGLRQRERAEAEALSKQAIKDKEDEVALMLKLEQELHDETEQGLGNYERLVKKTHKEISDDLERATDERINTLTREFIEGKKTAQQLADETLAIQIELTEDKLRYATENGIDILDLETQLLAYKKQLKDKELADFVYIEDKKREELTETQELQAELFLQSFGLFTAFQDREIAKLEEQKEKELAIAGDSKNARALIEQQYADKIAKIKRKQAIANKVQALFSIGLDTAKAIMYYSIKPLLLPWVIALGALQAAVVLATPIPKFFKGVRDFKGGFAEVGEQGAELFRTPDNKVGITPDKATTMFLPKGTDVFTPQESKRIIRDGGNARIDITELVKEQRLTRRAISGKPQHNTIINDEGMKYLIEKNGQRITYIEKFIRR